MIYSKGLLDKVNTRQLQQRHIAFVQGMLALPTELYAPQLGQVLIQLLLQHSNVTYGQFLLAMCMQMCLGQIEVVAN